MPVEVRAAEGDDSKDVAKGWRVWVGVALLVLLVIAELSLLSGRGQAAFPGFNGRIAFDSARDRNTGIYTINPDGSGATRLTSSSGNDVDPAFSPDGQKIAFVMVLKWRTRDLHHELRRVGTNPPHQCG